MKTILAILTFLAVSILTIAWADAQTQTATFNLLWTDNSSGASQEDGTNIERASTPTGSFIQVGQVGANVVAFSDVISNDPGNVQQCYRVKAFNRIGVSPASNVACGTSPVIQIVPGTPGNISVSVTVTVQVTP